MLHFLGDLLVITPRFVVCLAMVSMVGWALVVVLARHRRRAGSVVAGVLALLLTGSTAADAVNAHYQFLPRVDDVIGLPTWPTAPLAEALNPDLSAPGGNDRPERVVAPKAAAPEFPRGVVVPLPIAGPVSGFGTHKALVYLPPQYFTDQTRRFPVIYLLHGSPGAPVDWYRAAKAADAGYAAARAGHPVILVAPRASRFWTDDSECVNRPSEHMETYLAVDVPAAVDAALRTVPLRTARAVAGNSAGGYCALNLGLRHRDRFAGIVDLSGFARPTFDGGMAKLFGSTAQLRQVVAAEDPSQYASGIPVNPRMSIWLDTGRGDASARRDIERMNRVLTSRGQLVMLTERAGGHDYGAWRPGLLAGVLWMAPRLTGAAA
jgi:enterochelin esterase-like enzyme